jgi:hypothetical protein
LAVVALVEQPIQRLLEEILCLVLSLQLVVARDIGAVQHPLNQTVVLVAVEDMLVVMVELALLAHQDRDITGVMLVVTPMAVAVAEQAL